jgi:hypothetical protein
MAKLWLRWKQRSQITVICNVYERTNTRNNIDGHVSEQRAIALFVVIGGSVGDDQVKLREDDDEGH